MEQTLEDKIRVKTLEVSVERDPTRKAELQKQLTKFRLQKELKQLSAS
jgi:hypothetical protein